MNAAPPVYLDWNATTPLLPQVMGEMVDAMRHAWANPSSMHGPGQRARATLVDARARVARSLGATPAEVVFTSGATEANHLAVLGTLAARRAQAIGARRRWVLSAVEHPGLIALADRLSNEGTPITVLPVDGQGRLDLAAARAAMGDDVALVSVMAANNETGVHMPLAEIAALAQACGACLHVDATQLVGKAPLDFASSGVHLMSVSAHKIGGPKGAGALLVRRGVELVPLIVGRQERHRRGGTENLVGAVGFAAALEATTATLAEDIGRMWSLRQRLEEGLLRALPGTQIFGSEADRLPNTVCLSFGGLDAEQALQRLEREGVVASSGAACSAGGTQPSHVLLAMGFDARVARSGLRFSLGPATRIDDIHRTIAAAAVAIGPLLNDTVRTVAAAPAVEHAVNVV